MTSPQWQWKTWSDLPYLTCSLFEGWQHGWLTQQFSPRSPFEITPELFPGSAAYRVKQVHGNVVLAPSEMDSPLHDENLSDGDGVISQVPNQAVWVCTADCTPVLIGDVRTGQAAAVHAGWRGTAQKIVPVAIDRLVQAGSRLEDLRVGMGPAVSGECYQVQASVGIETAVTIAPEIAQLDEATAIAQLLDFVRSRARESSIGCSSRQCVATGAIGIDAGAGGDRASLYLWRSGQFLFLPSRNSEKGAVVWNCQSIG
jgi:polyphenol oxidase